MKLKISVLCISILFCFHFTEAQAQRALVIGINKYKPTERAQFPELKGCVNDAHAMKTLIQAKYNFAESNIKELYDTLATRDNILKSMFDLLDSSKEGDVAFIFYAGHGSQVKNSLNKEDNHLDQSIVPADTWKEGVPDIRNKELAALFNKFIDKGVILTCIFDCCHSGAIARGLQNDPPRFRYMPASDWDARDSSNPIYPESRIGGKYLILSAVQPNENEEEQPDENDIPHGAFTIALLKAISQQDVNGSVNNLFPAIHAILRSNGIIQEPVKAGDPERMEGTLFGLAKGSLSNKTVIPVISINGNKVKMQAGIIIGLNIENELTKVNGKAKIKITGILGPDLSEGDVIEGDNNIKPGDLFEVTNWVSSSVPFLKIYIPDSKLSYQKILQYAKILAVAKKSIHLINDFQNNEPDISFYFNRGNWWYIDPKKGVLLLNDFSAANLIRIAGNKKVNINIPGPQPLSDSLKSSILNYKFLQIVENPNDAQYALYGTVNKNNTLEYGLVRTQISSNDSFEMMPVQTKTFELKTNNTKSYNYITDSITEYTLRLSKIREWINIVPPQNDKFPFKLELRRSKTNKIIDSESLKVGEGFNLYFVKEKDFASRWDDNERYIYVFDIDQSGRMELLYPDHSSGNINNKFPKLDENYSPILEKQIGEYTAGEPVGTDNIYLLATDEAIPNYDFLFDQEGVRGVNSKGTFDDLISIGDATTRGITKIKTPSNWVLQRIELKTTH